MPKYVKPQVWTSSEFCLYKLIKNPVLTHSKRIELAGRTCYNSFSKITKDSYKKFIHGLIKSGHHSVIEFGRIILSLDLGTWAQLKICSAKFLTFTFDAEDSGNYLVSGNYRAWIDLLTDNKELNIHLREYLLYKFREHPGHGLFFEFLKYNYEVTMANDVTFFEFIDSTSKLSKYEKEYHKFYHFVIQTDRGVMAELTRHRDDCSFAIQSTRYVNYKDGVEFVIPEWYYKKPEKFLEKIKHFIRKYAWTRSCNDAESMYRKIIKYGGRPEEAREVLTNSTKTIINMYASLKEMRHIINLRTSKAAHPNIQVIANKMAEIIKVDL